MMKPTLSGSVTDLFDQDMLGRPITQGDTRTTNLAEKCVGSGYFFDDGRLTKTHLTKPLADLGFALKLLHPPTGTDG